MVLGRKIRSMSLDIIMRIKCPTRLKRNNIGDMVRYHVILERNKIILQKRFTLFTERKNNLNMNKRYIVLLIFYSLFKKIYARGGGNAGFAEHPKGGA